VDRVEIHWPSGAKEEITIPAVDCIYTVKKAKESSRRETLAENRYSTLSLWNVDAGFVILLLCLLLPVPLMLVAGQEHASPPSASPSGTPGKFVDITERSE